MRIQHWQDIASLLLGVWLVVRRSSGLRRGGYLGNHRAWVVRHSVCRRGICHSVLSGGVGRASPRSGSAGCTLDSRLRVGIGYGKQRGVGYIGDLVCSLGTDDRLRFHQLVARSLASPGRLMT